MSEFWIRKHGFMQNEIASFEWLQAIESTCPSLNGKFISTIYGSNNLSEKSKNFANKV